MRNCLVLALLAISALPGAAGAQTARCGWEFSEWVCRQDPATQQRQRSRPSLNFARPNTMDAYRRAEDARARQRLLDLEAQGREADNARAADEAAARRAIGAAIAEGRCDDARNMALRSGDIALAQQIPGLCRP